MPLYDYWIVGAGLFGATFAHEATQHGKRCLVLECRDHIGGNAYTEQVEGITVHRYGAHIFHTADRELWDYVNVLTPFRPYTHQVQAMSGGKMYCLPFNMNTFHALWGVVTPDEAMAEVARQTAAHPEEGESLEQYALSKVGKDIYETLIRDYTTKQWGRTPAQLPKAILQRIPLRFTYDNNYFNDPYQGIPQGGYTALVAKMLEGSDVLTSTDYHDYVRHAPPPACKTVYTGNIDRFFDYRLGALQYRSVRFETEVVNTPNYQGCPVVNYTDMSVPYTRIIEHKHFDPHDTPRTVISREYSHEWHVGIEPYYPINDTANNDLYNAYRRLAQECPKVIFGGRLGMYRYLDMSQTIQAARQVAHDELHTR